MYMYGFAVSGKSTQLYKHINKNKYTTILNNNPQDIFSFEPPDGLEKLFSSCFQMNCMINSMGSVVYRRRRTFQLLPDEA